METALVRELSNLIIRRRIKDDRLGLVSVTGVKLAPDLSHAVFTVSPFGTESENKRTWAALADNSNFFQSTLGRNLRLRQTPRITFEQDDSIREGDRILDLIEKNSATESDIE